MGTKVRDVELLCPEAVEGTQKMQASTSTLQMLRSNVRTEITGFLNQALYPSIKDSGPRLMIDVV